MRIYLGLLALLLVAAPASSQAADVIVSIGDGGFTPDNVVMHTGDRLVVANKSGKKQWVWGQGGDYAFDFRSTTENNWTHDPGQLLGIVMKFPGTYRIGNALDGSMHATVLVGQ